VWSKQGATYSIALSLKKGDEIVEVANMTEESSMHPSSSFNYNDRAAQVLTSRMGEMIKRWDKRYGAKAMVTATKVRKQVKKESELSDSAKSILSTLKQAENQEMGIPSLMAATGLSFYSMNGCLSILKTKGKIDSRTDSSTKTKIVFLK
jgi:hypothetical protein